MLFDPIIASVYCLPMKRIRYERLDENRVLIPRQGHMRVDGIVYADERLMRSSVDAAAMGQVANVACLPGILSRSLAMPDIHLGYGFPIGGVAAFDIDEGVISPGGVGYDINCGVRLLRSMLTADDVIPRMKGLVEALFAAVPAGLGSSRKDERLSTGEMRQVVRKGAAWAVERGMGDASDLEFLEEGGCLEGADFKEVSRRAFERGSTQLGTLGSGNHFIEIGVVDRVYDEEKARAFGLEKGSVTVSIHTGSRGFGHQVCTDFIPLMGRVAAREGIGIVDRQLACAPVRSPEGRRYLAAMAAAANFAFANRQVIMHRVCGAMESVLSAGPADLGLSVVYDVAHNIAKFETHEVDGRRVRVCVHRKGATRALPAGHPDLPDDYASVGQPVLVPGDMGRASFVLVGGDKAMSDTFGSSCHGAGRLLSRKAALRKGRGRDIRRELATEGVVVMEAGRSTLLEEMPEAYKDVEDVVHVIHGAGIAKRVVRLRPLGVIKG